MNKFDVGLAMIMANVFGRRIDDVAQFYTQRYGLVAWSNYETRRNEGQDAAVRRLRPAGRLTVIVTAAAKRCQLQRNPERSMRKRTGKLATSE
ncbi:hypothetical protein KIN20_034723 [Parelaphostrongylus tenuis]|uniref:Uncharacterized protein n=1 Tax=Parelaphostrongylus tenuis TaxID=148309 RepID=A0AAD5WJ73_PARTN|nr:hypothetical protein KIN20_034723 [Parelaphostrongylus tenuis]